MNKELFSKLWTQAKENSAISGVIFFPAVNEEFARLIVRECIQACINEGRTFEVESAGEYSSNLYATAIKEHFGVES